MRAIAARPIAIQEREMAGEDVGLAHRQRFQGLRPDADLGVLVGAETGAGGNQVPKDHVLFQADEIIDLADQGGLGEHRVIAD